jgi:hypothetical protein
MTVEAATTAAAAAAATAAAAKTAAAAAAAVAAPEQEVAAARGAVAFQTAAVRLRTVAVAVWERRVLDLSAPDSPALDLGAVGSQLLNGWGQGEKEDPMITGIILMAKHTADLATANQNLDRAKEDLKAAKEDLKAAEQRLRSNATPDEIAAAFGTPMFPLNEAAWAYAKDDAKRAERPCRRLRCELPAVFKRADDRRSLCSAGAGHRRVQDSVRAGVEVHAATAPDANGDRCVRARGARA